MHHLVISMIVNSFLGNILMNGPEGKKFLKESTDIIRIQNINDRKEGSYVKIKNKTTVVVPITGGASNFTA